MDKICVEHKKSLGIACLQQGCEKSLLCLLCYQDHYKDHSTELLTDLEKDKSWTNSHKIKKQALENHDLFASSPSQYDLIAKNKESIQMMINILVKKIQEKGKLLIEEMTQRIQEQSPMYKLLETLRENGEVLKRITFENDDICELVKEVKDFQENISPRIRKSMILMEDELKSWTINPTKLYQTELVVTKSIESISLDGIFTYSSIENDESNNQDLERYDLSSNQQNDEIFNLKKLLKEKTEKFYKEINLKNSSKEKGERTFKQMKDQIEQLKSKNNILVEQLNVLNTTILKIFEPHVTCGLKFKHISGKEVYHCNGGDGYYRCSDIDCKLQSAKKITRILNG